MACHIADAVMTKFSILRSSFRRELAKVRASKSGSAGDYTPKWKLFESLTFLADVVTPGKSSSNLDRAMVCVSILNLGMYYLHYLHDIYHVNYAEKHIRERYGRLYNFFF